MGTSNVRVARRTPIQRSLVSDLAKGDAGSIVRAATLSALPDLPKTHAIPPFYYALHAGLAVRDKTNQNFIAQALKHLVKPDLDIGDLVWEQASRLAGPSARTQAGKIAESALKRTYGSILKNLGPEAFEKGLESGLDALGKKVTSQEFVREFLANYFFEMILGQMRTTNDDLEYNGARAYHFAGGRLLTRNDEREFRKTLLIQCEGLARHVAARFIDTGLIAAVEKGAPLNEETLTAIQRAFSAAFHPEG